MMQTSQSGKDLIRDVEGCRLRVYRCSAGKLTIGIGHMLTQEELVGGKYDGGITLAEAYEILGRDLATAEGAVNKYVTVPLTQCEFDALVSFTFNVGAGAFRKSTLLRKLNAGDCVAVPDEMRKWVRVAGQRSQGLANRREKEIVRWKGGWK